MHQTAKDVCKNAEKLFSERWNLNNYWQTTAENFYPERADFTVQREIGDEFMDYLTTSYPVIARRDLGNALTSMLRTDEWFNITVERADRLDTEGKEWLEWASGTQRRAMYDRAAKFTRATKEGDHDFAAFGQAAISTELNRDGDKFLYKCHHLRDMAWTEDYEGDINFIAKKWAPTANQLNQRFPGKCHKNVTKAAEKDPFKKVNCFHVVMRSEDWHGSDKKRWIQPYVSLYVDKDNDHILEEVGSWSMIYSIPRWQTVSGSQYAYSPATIAALPDARLIQAVTLTLLDAGERGARPPWLAVADALRSDIDLTPDGITIIDADYDERLGDVMRPLVQDKSGIPYGHEIRNDVREMIAEAFYLNKLSMPNVETSREMTAFEVGQRVQEYIRQALPLFEPMEQEYNGALCEATFELGMRNGLFGPPHTFPESLRGQDVQFRFISPLSEATERKNGTAFLEAKQLLAQAAELDPNLIAIVDAEAALRDALTGVGVPTKWVRDEKAFADIRKQQAQMAQQQEMMAAAGQGAEVAERVGAASEQMTRAQQASEQ